MKKLFTLFLAAALTCGAAANTQAMDFKPFGIFDFAFEGYQNINIVAPFMDNSDARHNASGLGGTFGDLSELHQKHGGAVQRYRLGGEFIMSESLGAVYEAQIGTFTWGGPTNSDWGENAGGSLGGRATNISTRLAFLSWVVPSTDIKVRIGQQPLPLPSFTFGSPILDDTGTAVAVSAPINKNITLAAFWLRALSDSRRNNASLLSSHRDDNMDIFGLGSSFSYDGFKVDPWGMVGLLGKDQNFGGILPGSGYINPSTGLAQPSNNTFWFVGFGSELTKFDPFRFTLDAFYSANDSGHSFTDRAGWYVAAGAEYKTDYGTPALKGWYSSGDDNNLSNGSEQPLTLSGAFNPTSTYFDGEYSIPNNIDNLSPNGTWGISAQWNEISFIDKLSHDLSVTYFRGNNSLNSARFYALTAAPNHTVLTPGIYMTSKDAAWEFDFNSTYNLYQNLATVLELAYIMEDFSKSNWGQVYGLGQDARFSDIWRATLNFRYQF